MSTEEEKKKRREYMRQYNQTEKGKSYNRKHAHEWRKKTKAKRSPTRKSQSNSYRNAIIDFLIKRDGMICGICNESLEGSLLHINHVIPYALGGLDTLDNFNLSHPKCNIQQGILIRKEVHGY